MKYLGRNYAENEAKLRRFYEIGIHFIIEDEQAMQIMHDPMFFL